MITLRILCDVVYLERTRIFPVQLHPVKVLSFNMGIVTDDIRDNDFVEESNMSAEFMERVL